MSTQQIVTPDQIEPKLKEIWDSLAKENKTRACLFNLIVFNRYSPRTDYVRSIVQKVIDKFPCRVLFISEDPKADKAYLKTAVSVVVAEGPESSVACDYIDIGVAGDDLKKAPFLLLPHLIPDLPVTLLWTEDPSVDHSLFEPLRQLANRIIFDSESANSLLDFSKMVLSLNEKGYDVADLNWARTEGWRDLIGSLFNTPERLEGLQDLATLSIQYNARSTEFFCHLKIQAMYLLSWLFQRLHWNFKCASKDLKFIFETHTATIESTEWEKLGSGTVTTIHFETKKKEVFDCSRIKDRYHYVNI
jgi:glucose-6-phosphate dehydrogenase assembly protein OpcA